MGMYGLTLTLSPQWVRDVGRVGLGVCCLMTPGLSKDIRCHA